MADVTLDPILSPFATVKSKLSDLQIEDGQLIFIQDKRTIALDFGGKRTLYTQIEELATDGARTSMLAPVTGIIYFVIETSALWTYRDKWIRLNALPGDVEAALAEAKESGEFDGVSATHSWNGTTLTVTSASGTSSADLKGEKGTSGVYVGSGDMPEDCNVQIDPDGDAVLGAFPVRGIDYWTEEDKAEIVSDVIAALPVYNGEVVNV